jgi:hypothetical protein
LLMPCRLPLHPPRKNTCWITSFSSAVTSIIFEHVPRVTYCTCFVFISFPISIYLPAKLTVNNRNTKYFRLFAVFLEIAGGI